MELKQTILLPPIESSEADLTTWIPKRAVFEVRLFGAGLARGGLKSQANSPFMLILVACCGKGAYMDDLITH